LALKAVIIAQTLESLPLIADVITRGGVIAFRTDTFYGLGGDPFNQQAVQRVKALKGREENKPILIVLSDPEHLDRFIIQPSSAFKLLVEIFWPGALTIIGRAVADLPFEITAGSETVGVRLPGNNQVRALVRSCGGALTAPSANLSGQTPAKSAKDVERYFADEIDLILDSGPARTDQPSTVVDATGERVTLVREGAIAWIDISRALNR